MEMLEIVDDFSYLGVKFSYNGKFAKTKNHLLNRQERLYFQL
jgi:hypothetical protein